MKKIILISGKARHGKDTVADIMMDELGGRSTKIAVAYYLKDIAQRFYDWDGKKDERGRNLMQYLGTDIIRNQINEDFHINRLCEDIHIIFDDYDYIFVPDIRFENEIEVPINHFGSMVRTIRVNRPGYVKDMNRTQLNHKSETELDRFDFDFIVDNSGDIEHLQLQIKDILNNI